MNSKAKHWDKIFSSTEDRLLGWYEKDPSQLLKLLDLSFDWKDSLVFLPGIGTSNIIEELLSRGTRLILNDISQKVLDKIEERIGEKRTKVSLCCQDIALPLPDTIPKVDLWIDRAVLHFLTEEKDIVGYFRNLRSIVKKGGFTLFAQFSLKGASECAGLDITRYSVEGLTERLGIHFQLVTQFHYTHITPNGDPRPYVYVLYKRLSRKTQPTLIAFGSTGYAD